ncbi:hypothetical protein BC938DRAFT_483903 [Jimgerdemannia flammicorona]|uniref:Uncharacterized protein n=1 Tax=Jimgerdemannia flammicorona TaxID=994334 RepID=A0A433QAZ8_9FUNG|nr:hypothetical protein BC938DRAFT_483903 [Jimgerdemannia flammicorona]
MDSVAEWESRRRPVTQRKRPGQLASFGDIIIMGESDSVGGASLVVFISCLYILQVLSSPSKTTMKKKYKTTFPVVSDDPLPTAAHPVPLTSLTFLHSIGSHQENHADGRGCWQGGPGDASVNLYACLYIFFTIGCSHLTGNLSSVVGRRAFFGSALSMLHFNSNPYC